MKHLLATCVLVTLFAGCAQVPNSTSAALPSLVNTETTVRPLAQPAAPLSRGSLVQPRKSIRRHTGVCLRTVVPPAWVTP